VALDGFRHDYPELHGAPTLLRLAREGVRSDGLVPVFPSKTFPSHYTIVTGLWPERHGIVGNNMWDPEWDARFSLGNRAAVQDARWWGGEPLWVTAQTQGRVAAALYWPGSEAPIRGVRPTHWRAYDGSLPGEARVDRALAWLDLPAPERPSLVTLYFSDTDEAGHEFGPEAAQTREAVRRLDGHLARLLSGLEARGIDDEVNLVVVADHGMARQDPEKTIVLEDFLDLDDVRIVDLSGCIAMMRPREGREARVLAALEGAHPHLHVYRKEDVPQRLHYRDHRRITPVVSWSDPGWTIYATAERREAGRRRFALGQHGFDPAERDMHGVFVARGPAFRARLRIPPIESVHLYELMARALGLAPAPNDGDPEVVRPLLAAPAARSSE
jgi:predicted AlkP superfamily pyrophosphatase or phosphodiesterase